MASFAISPEDYLARNSAFKVSPEDYLTTAAKPKPTLAPPPMPKPPLPQGLKSDEQVQSEMPSQVDPKSGVWFKERPMGQTPILDSPYTGFKTAKEGVEQLATPLSQYGASVPGAIPSNGLPARPRGQAASNMSREVAGGSAKVIGGAFEAATPLMAGGLVTAPIRTALTLGAGMLAQRGTQAGLEKAGVAPEYADLAGNVAALAAGGLAHAGLGKMANFKVSPEAFLKTATPTADAPIPEAPDTLKIQTDQLSQGQRKAVLFPEGSEVPEKPAGMNRVKTSDGMLYYDPQKISAREIRRAVQGRRLNEVLGDSQDGYGAPAKQDLQGEPQSVVSKAPDGTVVQGALTDQQNLPQTMDAAQKVTPPGGQVAVESPQKTITDRVTEASKDGVEINRGSSTQIPLSPEGQGDVQELGQKMAKQGGVDQLLTSDSIRAEQTADAVAKQNPQPVQPIPSKNLESWAQGDLEGRPAEQVKDQIAQLYKNPTTIPEGQGIASDRPGESFNQFKQRYLGEFTKIIDQWSKDPTQKVGVVTHSQGIKTLDAWLANGHPDDLSLDMSKIREKSSGDTASVKRLAPGPDGQWKLTDVDLDGNEPLQEGIYIARHGDTPWNVQEPVREIKSNTSQSESDRSGPFNISRLNEGKPGVSLESDPYLDRRKVFVYRDQSGRPQGYLQFYLADDLKVVAPPDHGLYPEVYVNPEARRSGIATQLYDTADKAGFDLSKVSGTETTPHGAAFLNARRAAPRPNRSPDNVSGANNGEGAAGLDHNQSGLFGNERGGISADALTAPARAIGLDKFIEQDVRPGIVAGARTLAEAWDGIKRGVAPASRGADAKDASLTMREHMAEKQRQYDIFSNAAEPLYKGFAKIAAGAEKGDAASRSAIVDFIDRVERGAKQSTPELQKAADVFREMFDQRTKDIQALGTGALENAITDYFPHLWKDPVKARSILQQLMIEKYSVRPLEGGKSFLKQRSIEFFKDGIERGLEPISWNPVDMAAQRVVQMDKYIMAQRILKEMKTSDLVKFVRTGTNPPEGFEQINDNIATVRYMNEQGQLVEAGKYWASDPVAQLVNNHLSPGLRNNRFVGAGYRTLFGAANWMNQFNLGLSGFHAGFTSFEANTSQLALGLYQAMRGELGKAGKSVAEWAPQTSFLTNAVRGLKGIKEWDDPGSQSGATGDLIDALKSGGFRPHMDRMYATNMRAKFNQTWQSGNYPGALARFVPAALEKSNSYILEKLVPMQKTGVAMKMMESEMDRLGPLSTHEDVRAVAAKIADTVDNRLGQLAYDNLFWNKTFKDIAMLSVRSVGWNLGTYRELAGGALDASKTLSKTGAAFATGTMQSGLKGGITAAKGAWEPTYKMAYLAALPVQTALYGAMLTYLFTGKGPQEARDYFFPPDGTLDENGRPQRWNMWGYVKDVVHTIQKPAQTAKNKLNPIFGTMAEMVTNKDYYGRQIRNEDDPEFKQLMDTTGYGLKKFFTPFSVSGLSRERELGASATKQALPFIGLTPASPTSMQSPAEALMAKYAQQDQPQSRPQITQRNLAKNNISRMVKMGRADEASRIAQDGLNNGVITEDDVHHALDRVELSPLVADYKRLSLDRSLSVLRLAKADEKQKLLPVLFDKLNRQYSKLPPADQSRIVNGLRSAGVLQ